MQIRKKHLLDIKMRTTEDIRSRKEGRSLHTARNLFPVKHVELKDLSIRILDYEPEVFIPFRIQVAHLNRCFL